MVKYAFSNGLVKFEKKSAHAFGKLEIIVPPNDNTINIEYRRISRHPPTLLFPATSLKASTSAKSSSSSNSSAWLLEVAARFSWNLSEALTPALSPALSAALKA